jgi:hypothetical protein
MLYLTRIFLAENFYVQNVIKNGISNSVLTLTACAFGSIIRVGAHIGM